MLKRLIYRNHYLMFYNNIDQNGNLGDNVYTNPKRSVIVIDFVVFPNCLINNIFHLFGLFINIRKFTHNATDSDSFYGQGNHDFKWNF